MRSRFPQVLNNVQSESKSVTVSRTRVIFGPLRWIRFADGGQQSNINGIDGSSRTRPSDGNDRFGLRVKLVVMLLIV